MKKILSLVLVSVMSLTIVGGISLMSNEVEATEINVTEEPEPSGDEDTNILYEYEYCWDDYGIAECATILYLERTERINSNITNIVVYLIRSFDLEDNMLKFSGQEWINSPLSYDEIANNELLKNFGGTLPEDLTFEIINTYDLNLQRP